MYSEFRVLQNGPIHPGKSSQCYVFKVPSQFFLASVSICLIGALGGFILHDNSPQ